MIAHLVLFRPRADLSESDRRGLTDALATALGTIPSIRRARIGRRIIQGRSYEALMRIDYTYAALLEFDDVAGLKAYLEHPAHEALGARFFSTFEETLIYDFDFVEDPEAIQRLLGEAGGGSGPPLR
jgi:hypothetical protein